VATVNSSLELTVGSPSKEKPTVTRALKVATCTGRFLLCFQEFRDVDTGFAQDGAKRALCHIARMVGQGDFAARDSVPPDFMTTRTGAVKGEPEGSQLAGHFAIPEPSEATH
jgi:hypothetical protein